jgi:hypothetical protein
VVPAVVLAEVGVVELAVVGLCVAVWLVVVEVEVADPVLVAVGSEAPPVLVVEPTVPQAPRIRAARTATSVIPIGWVCIQVIFVDLAQTSFSPASCARGTIHPMSAEAEHQQGRHRFLSGLHNRDPYWGPQLVVAAAIALDFALPDKLTIGPSWLLPSLEAVVLLGLIVVTPHPRWRHSPLRRRIALVLIAAVSALNIVSLVLLAHYLLHGGKAGGHELIGSGILLWATNVLLFAVWYWQLDRGGPVARHAGNERQPDFMFVQMSQPQFAPSNWQPGLVDYLYTSFTNATAFSPTDTMPLTATAKWLMSAQALTSLVTVGLIFARAVNILA